MNYVSTRNSSNSFRFKDVFIKGLADDGGLFIPISLHRYSKKDLDVFKNLEYIDIDDYQHDEAYKEFRDIIEQIVTE